MRVYAPTASTAPTPLGAQDNPHAAGAHPIMPLETTATLAAPGAPAIGTAASGVTTDTSVSATAKWSAPTNNGGSAITEYQVQVYTGGGKLVKTVSVPGSTPSGQPTTSAVVNSGLTSGSTYKFKVLAVNAIGASPLSAFSNTVTAR